MNDQEQRREMAKHVLGTIYKAREIFGRAKKDSGEWDLSIENEIDMGLEVCANIELKLNQEFKNNIL